jgi:hypothetical protein
MTCELCSEMDVWMVGGVVWGASDAIFNFYTTNRMFLPCLLTLCDEAQQRAWVPLAESKKARPV